MSMVVLTDQGLAGCMCLTWKENFLLEQNFFEFALCGTEIAKAVVLYPEMSSRENMQSCCQKAVYR